VSEAAANEPLVAVAVVARHAIDRAALAALIAAAPDTLLVTEAGCCREALERAEGRADVLVLSVERAGDLEEAFPGGHRDERPHLLVLGGEDVVGLAKRAAEAGARGFVTKRQPAATLLDAVRGIHRGEAWFDRTMIALLIAEAAGIRAPATEEAPEKALFALSDGEREIVAGVAEGLTNRALAERCGLSEPAVRHALTRIYRALAVKNRMGLARLALQIGLAEADGQGR
jgi:DNA-binding NarL/FixJ family response regulator